MKQKYYCEKCDKEFYDEEECLEHEQTCNTKVTFQCYKCGKVIEYDIKDEWAFSYAEECHTIDLGRAGYESGLDGCDIHIQVCDDCLIEWINSFTVEGQEKVLNSGSNTDLPTDVWIREAKGELTDEEYEEYGMYSPRQIKAYEERFPKCKHTKIHVYNDGSANARCYNGAFGDEFGKCDINVSNQCYGCEDFKERPDGAVLEIVDAGYKNNTPIEVIEEHKRKYLEYINNKNK